MLNDDSDGYLILFYYGLYLQNRYFSLQIYKEYSSKKLNSHGVPQYSVFSSIIFLLYRYL